MKTPHARVATARFWIFHRDGWVKLSVRPLQALTVCEGGQTDEGYDYTVTTYEHCGPFVRCTWQRTARDCDGPISQDGEATCPLADLAAGEMPTYDPGITVPNWQKPTLRQRDYAAEAMGY